MALASPPTAIAELRHWLERVEAHGRTEPGVLPFGVDALDSSLPQGGLLLGHLHEVIEAGAASEYAGLEKVTVIGVVVAVPDVKLAFSQVGNPGYLKTDAPDCGSQLILERRRGECLPLRSRGHDVGRGRNHQGSCRLDKDPLRPEAPVVTKPAHDGGVAVGGQ